MALNKVSLPIARGSKSDLDLPAHHVTTMSFLQGQPVYYRHVVKGEHVEGNLLGTIRPIALNAPCFADIHCNLRAFYVPYRLVFPQYDAFRTDVIGADASNTSLVTGGPFFYEEDLEFLFLYTIFINPDGTSSVLSTAVSNPTATPRNYDFMCTYNNTPFSARKYTALGRRFLKILYSLGYKVLWGENGKFYWNALALMSFARVYLDWYANAQYLDSADVLTLRKIFAFNDPTSEKHLSNSELSALLRLVFVVVYDTDSYFVHAWDNPVSPNSNQSSIYSFTDITYPNSGAIVDQSFYGSSSNPYSTPVMRQDLPAGSWNSYGTQYLHDALQKLTNYQKRHALVGAREIDRVLADHGFVQDNLRLQRSVYITNNSISVDIGDVMSHADTAGANEPNNLGEYAGRGFGQRDGKFDYVADEDGLFIIVASMLPSAGMYQGYDRNNRHHDKLDYFTEEFDQLGVQVIEKGEVYVSNSSKFFDQATSNYASGFGFTGRYGEYKAPRSWISGDVAIPSLNQQYANWHLMRMLADGNFSDSIDNVVHSLDFTRGSDWMSYNRIFNDTGWDTDKFFCDFHFDVHSYFPGAPLFETYDFKEVHKRIKTDINGSTLN